MPHAPGELKLAIGMAVYDDYPGLWMTVQCLRLYHADIIKNCELIVVDNHPESDHGRACRDLIQGWVRGDFLKTTYTTFTQFNSTAWPRQMVFDLASAPNVIVMDPHVILPFHADTTSCLEHLINYYDSHPDCYNLIQGPMVYDDLNNVSTHMNDKIRAEMWGTWDRDVRMDTNHPLEPFEIPAHGLGLFSARKEAWKKIGGFNPNFRGFGGEEWYIHEKFRRLGQQHGVDGRTLCLPILTWMHRFGHIGGVRYPLNVYDKLRNYLIGAKELRLGEAHVKRLLSQFVDMKNEDENEPVRQGVRVTPTQWNNMVRAPEAYPISL